MDSDVQFPLFVQLDDRGMIRIAKPDQILCELESIDIENGEYLFWDANGDGLAIQVRSNRVISIQKAEHGLTLREAFDGYAAQLSERGEPVDTNGNAEEVWTRFEAAMSRLPRPKGFFATLFGRSKR